MFQKLTFSRYHISHCSDSLLSHCNCHNLNYQELKLIHIKFTKRLKMCFSLLIFLGRVPNIFWSPPAQAVAHSAQAPVAEHAPCSQPEKLVPGPGARWAGSALSVQARAPSRPASLLGWAAAHRLMRVCRHFTSHLAHTSPTHLKPFSTFHKFEWKYEIQTSSQTDTFDNRLKTCKFLTIVSC